MAKTDKKDTSKLNPTITAAFRNDKFGVGNYLSKPIDADALKTIMNNVQLGSRILLKSRERIDDDNNPQTYFFLEVLPPYNRDNVKRGNTRSQEDGEI